MARRSATKARTQTINQLHALVVTAPDQVKHQLGGLSPKARHERSVPPFVPAQPRPLSPMPRKRCVYWPADTRHSPQRSNNSTPKSDHSAPGVNPALLSAPGVGPDTAAALLVTAGDNPERMRTEASFAALCGASPIQASSGPIVRHRLNRGGDRQANNALWRIATTRMRSDQPTIEYVQRRQSEGKTRKEIIRCLKRYIARQVYQLLTNPPQTPNGAHLRCLRQNTQTSLAQAATAVHAHPTRISQLERGLYHNHQLATRYHQWLTATKPCEYVGGALRVCQARRSGGVVTLQNPDRFCLYRPVRVFKSMCPTPFAAPAWVLRCWPDQKPVHPNGCDPSQVCRNGCRSSGVRQL